MKRSLVYILLFLSTLFVWCHTQSLESIKEQILDSLLSDVDLVHSYDNTSHDNYEQFRNLTTTEIIEQFGYVTETHHVTTDDGYILELHRIPVGIEGVNETEERPVIFMQHGMMCSSSDWVMDKPDRALAYLLADAGYDVWMNNFRGNTYSRKHKNLDPDKDKKHFWNFSWDEMALIDLPNAIDYTLNLTGQSQVYYVGFSLGTTTLFSLLSERPEFGDKIKASALLGPVVYLDHLKGPLRVVAKFSNQISTIAHLTNHYEVFKSGPLMDWSAEHCEKGEPLTILCYNILFLLCGYDREELNKDYLPIVVSHTPAGTSVNTINHYFQIFNSGVYQKYNFGTRKNIKRYGQDTPPGYRLNMTTPPIGLFWGENDWMAPPEGVARIASELENVVFNYRVMRPKWNHLDFIWGKEAKEYVYDHVIEFLQRY